MELLRKNANKIMIAVGIIVLLLSAILLFEKYYSSRINTLETENNKLTLQVSELNGKANQLQQNILIKEVQVANLESEIGSLTDIIRSNNIKLNGLNSQVKANESKYEANIKDINSNSMDNYSRCLQLCRDMERNGFRCEESFCTSFK